MTEFTASNGVKIKLTDNSQIIDYARGHIGDTKDDVLAAFEEFFRAREDARLGRWRWPKDPDYVVYIRDGEVPALVFRESTGVGFPFSRGQAPRDTQTPVFAKFAQAAVAYFEAHKEPEPAWRNAKPGEVWFLKVSGAGMALAVDSRCEFQGLITLSPASSSITAGRRIYPPEGDA